MVIPREVRAVRAFLGWTRQQLADRAIVALNTVIRHIGVVYEGKFGQTASFARRVGESTDDVRFVFGVRIWF
jgi:hypothetical protein